MAAALGEHDKVPSVFKGHFEASCALEGVSRGELEADDGVLVGPGALAAEDAAHLDGGGVAGQGVHARLEGGGRAVGPPGDVGSLAEDAARRGEPASGD